MKRQIIRIDEEKCTGCGACVPGCPEGALQIIDGKARLVSEIFCDGLGACIGTCPEGAITVEEREAEEYDEIKTMLENIIPKGDNTILAHLKHLKDHGQTQFLKQAFEALKIANKDYLIEKFHAANHHQHTHGHQCPSSVSKSFNKKTNTQDNYDIPSELTHWPIQLHLINPQSEIFYNADLLIAADCTAFSAGNFHSKYLKNKKLIIACPKLDNGIEIYISKIKDLIEYNKINTITVLRMQVPCCAGLVTITQEAINQSNTKVPLKEIVISIEGEEISNKWIN